MEYEGQLTADDLLRGFALHQRGVRWTPRLIALWVGIVLGTVVLMQLWPSAGGVLLGAAFALLVVGVLVLRITLPRRLRRLYRERASVRAPFRSRLDATGFETSSESDSSRRPWAELQRWRENAEYILLYESSDSFRIIPKRLLQGPGQLEEARQLLTLHLGPAK
jgi:hypothetical protein